MRVPLHGMPDLHATTQRFANPCISPAYIPACSSACACDVAHRLRLRLANRPRILLVVARDLMRTAAAELTGRAEAAASMAGKASALVQLLDGLLPPLAARTGRRDQRLCCFSAPGAACIAWLSMHMR